MDRRILRRTAARLAEETLAALGDGAARCSQVRTVSVASASRPRSFRRAACFRWRSRTAATRLAQQAAAGRPISSADIAWLAGHRAARMHRAELAVLEAMARISRYLDQPFSPKTDLLDQVREYQLGGAFADLAMLQLRRALASSVHYHAEANKVSRRAANAATVRIGISPRPGKRIRGCASPRRADPAPSHLEANGRADLAERTGRTAIPRRARRLQLPGVLGAAARAFAGQHVSARA